MMSRLGAPDHLLMPSQRRPAGLERGGEWHVPAASAKISISCIQLSFSRP
jgi:hypothetical protein